ncbi:winged helix-turn-helix transcriptional regulator [Mesorhizobium sp. ZMM04-5]|uniref:Winged helix-turn-helix transcriptional regulator n=1 Tax=Mesorhizobium marinum TaxID=3228790 RepID=A0ABV3QZV6_9HYPH
MKLEKITKTRRSYEDACGTAHALDLIGERWALLVMRELMLGPRRFSDLRESLPGVSANVLTQRLEGLEQAGVVRRRKLPPPAPAQIYELTEWGLDAEPVILALGRWGARSPLQDPDLPLSAVGMALSFRAMFLPERAIGTQLTLGLETPRDRFTLQVSNGRIAIERGGSGAADAVIAGEPGEIAGFVYGLAAGDPLGEGRVTISGDRTAVDRFRGMVSLPPLAC